MTAEIATKSADGVAEDVAEWTGCCRGLEARSPCGTRRTRPADLRPAAGEVPTRSAWNSYDVVASQHRHRQVQVHRPRSRCLQMSMFHTRTFIHSLIHIRLLGLQPLVI